LLFVAGHTRVKNLIPGIKDACAAANTIDSIPENQWIGSGF